MWRRQWRERICKFFTKLAEQEALSLEKLISELTHTCPLNRSVRACVLELVCVCARVCVTLLLGSNELTVPSNEPRDAPEPHKQVRANSGLLGLRK